MSLKNFISENKNALLGLFFFLSLLAGILAYRSLSRPPVIRIAVSQWPGFAPAVYAEYLGLYKKYGVPIEVVYSTGPAQSNHWLLSEQVDGVCAVLTDVIQLRSAGFPVQMLLFSDYSKEADSLMAREEIKNISDLKGKTIGIDSLNSFSHIFVLKTLEKYGISESEVFFKIVPFDRVAQALLKNEIQAGHTWDPGLQEALDSGFKRIATAGEIPGIVLDGMAFRQDLLVNHPEIFWNFKRAFYEAQSAMLDEPLKASQALKYFFKNEPVAFAKSFSELHFISKEENDQNLDPQSADSYFKIANDLNDFYLKRGQASDNDVHLEVIVEGFRK